MEENPNNDQPLGLEPENNQLMEQKPSETAELTDDAKLSEYFGRVLSGGQIDEPTPQAEETNVDAETEVGESNEAEISQETEVEESRPELEVPKGVTKRIAKLTAQRKEAEEKAKKLEEELESIKREQAVSKKPVNSKNPFGTLDSEEKIQAEYERQKEIRLFCERYPDGYYEEGKEPLDKEQIAKAKVNAIRAIEDFLPQQYNYVSKSKEFKTLARKEFPWLDDSSDQRAIAAKRFIEAVPAIKEFPDYEIYAAHLANGMISYSQQKAAAKKNAPINQRVPVMPSSNFAPPTLTPKNVDSAKAADAANRYRRTSSLDDLADVFKNKFV